MTCEVVVMNRLGIVLAADSAITFQNNSDKGATTSFSTGANKIFQISNHEPVGAMIFNNASLHEIPWELVLKSFRAQLVETSYESINHYGDALTDFIVKNKNLFPNTHLEEQTKKFIASSVFRVLNWAVFISSDLKDKSKSLTEHQKAWDEFVIHAKDFLKNTPFSQSFNATKLKRISAKYTPWLNDLLPSFLANESEFPHLAPVINTLEFSKLAIETLVRLYKWVLNDNYTGVVIAGYGKEQCFPAYVEHKYYGFIDNILIVELGKQEILSHEGSDSQIEAFAQQAMVETFVKGYSFGTWNSVMDEFSAQAKRISEELALKTGFELPPNWNEELKKYSDEFSKVWTKILRDQYLPLRKVIAGLSVQEMSELAETLVMLESLKEKVTVRTQSVGGPVDVAVITKHEGLVWIKRKLYFDPNLNSRYFARQQKNH